MITIKLAYGLATKTHLKQYEKKIITNFQKVYKNRFKSF